MQAFIIGKHYLQTAMSSRRHSVPRSGDPAKVPACMV